MIEWCHCERCGDHREVRSVHVQFHEDRTTRPVKLCADCMAAVLYLIFLDLPSERMWHWREEISKASEPAYTGGE